MHAVSRNAPVDSDASEALDPALALNRNGIRGDVVAALSLEGTCARAVG
jgi:hypothetical protein